MPIYTVGNRLLAAAWSLPAGPPGPAGNRPRATMAIGNAQAVGMGAMSNVPLTPLVSGLYTMHLANCSAFCILWCQNGGPPPPADRASLIHMLGGPDPNAVNWAAMLHGMGPGGTYYGILANSQATVLSAGLVAAALNNTPIPAANLWVYDAQSPGGVINFGLDRDGHAGEC